MAEVISVNISEKKGEQKHPVREIQLKLRHGIVGDAHAGDWHRQISLLAEESIDSMRAACPVSQRLRHQTGGREMCHAHRGHLCCGGQRGNCPGRR